MTVSELKDFLDKCEKSGVDKEADVVIETYRETSRCGVIENLVNAYTLGNGKVFLKGSSMREV